jgi:hypothetical protein
MAMMDERLMQYVHNDIVPLLLLPFTKTGYVPIQCDHDDIIILLLLLLLQE